MKRDTMVMIVVCLPVAGAVSGAMSLCTGDAAKGVPLHERFRSPQGTARENTGPLFWLHGTESEARLREYVGCVAESGQGILTVESRPHKDWMREGWWRDVDIVLDECRRHGIKMMVFDDYWWPSQGMGGKYPIPEKYHSVDVKGSVCPKDAAPQGKVTGEIARVNAMEVSKGTFRIADDGDKTIIYTTVPLEKGTPNWWRFPTLNGLDEDAVDWFIANYYQPYYDRYRHAFEDGTIPGFFFDEPQFRSWWGSALKKELDARGENVGELLTALKFSLADPEGLLLGTVPIGGNGVRTRAPRWTESDGTAIETFVTGGNVRLHEPFTDRQIGLFPHVPTAVGRFQTGERYRQGLLD